MGKNKPAKIKGQAARQNLLKGQADVVTPPRLETFCINLKHYDSSQGQSFKDWEELELLAKLLDRWHAHSGNPLEKCLDNHRFKRYRTFPQNSDFKPPKGVPEDAVWASMHLQGKECVAGHTIGNVFYVVFLDKDHRFWPVELKRT